MNVLMALADFIPVLIFTATAVILQRGLYNRMSKGAFALFAAGTIMISVGGFFKAVWKLLYALGLCNFERLNQAFFPMQSIGFLLAGAGIAAMTFFKQKSTDDTLNSFTLPLIMAAAPAVFSGTFIFVGCNVLGTLLINLCLSIEAKKQRKPFAIAMFTLSFILMLFMGYLSSKDFEQAGMNWIAEGVNSLGQLTFLLGALKVTKK